MASRKQIGPARNFEIAFFTDIFTCAIFALVSLSGVKKIVAYWLIALFWNSASLQCWSSKLGMRPVILSICKL